MGSLVATRSLHIALVTGLIFQVIAGLYVVFPFFYIAIVILMQ